MKQIFLNTIQNDLQKYMEEIKLPTLLIRGKNDTETPLREAQIIHSKIKNSSLKIIPEGTHFVYEEFPEEVAKYIINFIQ
jgi:pimeloyl-ACP methyl ester carboxylesterase